MWVTANCVYTKEQSWSSKYACTRSADMLILACKHDLTMSGNREGNAKQNRTRHSDTRQGKDKTGQEQNN